MNFREFIADPGRDCAVVAHRGLWRGAPENSLLAIERAISAGHDVVEIDIRRSADGELFLLHDEALTRMTGLAHAVEELSSQQLKELRLRNRDGGDENSFTQERVPSLREVFDLTRDRIFLHLDVKQRAVIPGVVALAKGMGVAGQVDFWASLKSAEDLTWIRETIEPHDVLFMAKTHLNVPTAASQMALLSELSPPVCEIYFDRLEQLSAVDGLVRENGMALWVNTLDSVACAGFTDMAAQADPDAVWGRLIDAGVSVIQTDEAAALKSYLAARRT
ncbi:glycerophosphodiester phosphodiesterase family protein [Neorhizobium alkalisoli]|uniref:glycerophosphodiester phosphodiesterase family protein n=1 Tax=Neorhizobium alkalisoli TaxID=528178 RepID=UPI000CF9BF59|nr:glycerophosphodiester phosphodiesterase family protein [Neorhizobium alkalisoli]